MKKLLTLLAVMALSLGANAGTLELDQDNLNGTIFVDAALAANANVQWTQAAMDDGGAAATTVNVDLGEINPLSADHCADLAGNSNGVNQTDFSDVNIACAVTSNDMFVSIPVDYAVIVGGTNLVDIDYTVTNDNATDGLGLLAMSDAADASSAAGTEADTLDLADGATGTHHLRISLPLNAKAGEGYTTHDSFTGSIAVDITVAP